MKLLGVIPSPYLQYYYQTREKVKKVRDAGFTRGEQVCGSHKQDILHALYTTPATTDLPGTVFQL